MLQYQKETLTQRSDPLMEHQKKMQELEELARKAMMARAIYDQANEQWKTSALALLNKARELGVERITVDGVPIKFKPETVEEIDVELANVLRSKLSKDQWEECFEEKIVPKKRGINKFLKMGGPIADTIRAYIRSVPAKPVPSAVEFGKRES